MPPALTNTIRSLPSRGAETAVEDVLIEVKAMRWEHVNLWHSEIQPLIDTNYRHWQPGIAPQDVRADVGWDWSKIYALALLHNTVRYIPGNKSGPAQAFAMVIRNENDDEIPVGMVTVVPRFSCSLQGVVGERTFAWYFADAPTSFYTKVLGVGPLVGVAAALLDTAIQSGLNMRANGSILLHADPNGGNRLADFYLQRCKMTQLSMDSPPISAFRRKNIDQYFFLSAAGAAEFCKQFDVRR